MASGRDPDLLAKWPRDKYYAKERPLTKAKDKYQEEPMSAWKTGVVTGQTRDIFFVVILKDGVTAVCYRDYAAEVGVQFGDFVRLRTKPYVGKFKDGRISLKIVQLERIMPLVHTRVIDQNKLILKSVARVYGKSTFEAKEIALLSNNCFGNFVDLYGNIPASTTKYVEFEFRVRSSPLDFKLDIFVPTQFLRFVDDEEGKALSNGNTLFQKRGRRQGDWKKNDWKHGKTGTIPTYQKSGPNAIGLRNEIGRVPSSQTVKSVPARAVKFDEYFTQGIVVRVDEKDGMAYVWSPDSYKLIKLKNEYWTQNSKQLLSSWVDVRVRENDEVAEVDEEIQIIADEFQTRIEKGFPEVRVFLKYKSELEGDSPTLDELSGYFGKVIDIHKYVIFPVDDKIYDAWIQLNTDSKTSKFRWKISDNQNQIMAMKDAIKSEETVKKEKEKENGADVSREEIVPNMRIGTSDYEDSREGYPSTNSTNVRSLNYYEYDKKGDWNEIDRATSYESDHRNEPSRSGYSNDVRKQENFYANEYSDYGAKTSKHGSESDRNEPSRSGYSKDVQKYDNFYSNEESGYRNGSSRHGSEADRNEPSRSGYSKDERKHGNYYYDEDDDYHNETNRNESENGYSRHSNSRQRSSSRPRESHYEKHWTDDRSSGYGSNTRDFAGQGDSSLQRTNRSRDEKAEYGRKESGRKEKAEEKPKQPQRPNMASIVKNMLRSRVVRDAMQAHDREEFDQLLEMMLENADVKD